MNDSEIDIKKRGSILFKEKIFIPENEWISNQNLFMPFSESGLVWRLLPNGNIERSFGGKNVENLFKGDTGFHKSLPGIQNVSRKDFEFFASEGLGIFNYMRNQILARELGIVNKRTASSIDNWINEIKKTVSGYDNHIGVLLLLDKADSEGILEFRIGKRRTYLPSGHAAETILTFGHKFLDLNKIRKLVEEFKKGKVSENRGMR